MAAQPEVSPELAGIIQSVVKNAPGKLLPAHKRYALSIIADGQSERINSDDFTKSASQGVSPDAHAADRAANDMAAAVGIAPPPMPAPDPAAAGQSAFQQASGQDQGSYNGTAEGAGAPGPGAPTTATAQPGPSNPPPNTYYDVDKKVSVYDPNYHGPYMPVSGGQPVGSDVTAQPATPNQGAQPKLGEMPVHQYAPLDQKRIDDAWQAFDTAMAKMPTPPDPAKLPEIGMTQLIAMAVAGIIDPQAAAVVGKALFEAPVMAKMYADKERQDRYGDSVRLWQNETQRYQNAALGVERSEVAKQRNLQGAYDKDYERQFGLYSQREKQQQISDRAEKNKLYTRLTQLDRLAATSKLSASELADLNDARNRISLMLNSDAPVFDADGKPTEEFRLAEQRLAESESRVKVNNARIDDFASKIGLRREQAEKISTMLPYEVDRMVAQTGVYNATRVRTLYDALYYAERITDMQFRRNLDSDKFQLEKAKVGLAEVDKRLAERNKERETLSKAVGKAQEEADKFNADYGGGAEKFTSDAVRAQYEGLKKKVTDAQAKVDDLNPAIDSLNQVHSTLKAGLDEIDPPEPGTSGATIEGVSGMARSDSHRAPFVQAVKERIGKPYVWGGGRDKGADSNMDCSGLVCDAFEAIGMKPPGSTANEMYENTVSVTDPQPSDLLFFDWNDDGKIDHVAVYVGNGKMVHASSGSKKTIEVDAREYIKKQGHFVKIGRVPALGQQTAPQAALPEPGQTPKRKPRGKPQPQAKPAKESYFGSQDMGGK